MFINPQQALIAPPIFLQQINTTLVVILAWEIIDKGYDASNFLHYMEDEGGNYIPMYTTA